MRASGRGGRQGPRGDRIPPRALVAFMGEVRAACSAFRGRLLLRAGLFCAWRVSYARNVYTFRVSSAHAALFRVLGRVSLE